MAKFYYPSNVPNINSHHWGAGVVLAHSIAHKGAVAGAKAFAAAVTECFANPEVVAEAKRTLQGGAWRRRIQVDAAGRIRSRRSSSTARSWRNSGPRCEALSEGAAGVYVRHYRGGRATNGICSLPPCGGGLGRGVTSSSEFAVTPLPVPPPQGGRERRGADFATVITELASSFRTGVFECRSISTKPTSPNSSTCRPRIQALRDAFAARGARRGQHRAAHALGVRRAPPQRHGRRRSRREALRGEVLRLRRPSMCCSIRRRRVCSRSSRPMCSGQIRTGAASAVASEKMARPGAGKVALIGTGRQARTQALALKAVGMLSELAVSGRDARQARSLLRASSAEELGAPVACGGVGRGGGGGRRHRRRRHQFGDAGGDGRLAQARHACERHRGECGQSPRDRSRDRAQGLARRHRRHRAGEDRSRRVHRSRQGRQARLEPGQAAASRS